MTNLLCGPCIITRYLGPTDRLGSRVVATHRRDSSCHPWRKVVPWDHALDSTENHKAAADALLASWPYTSALVIIARGHDADAYYWLCCSAPEAQA